MSFRDHLPSGQFAALAGSLFLATGLIFLAARTNPDLNATLYASQTAAADHSQANPDWQEAFIGNTVPQQMADIQNQANQLMAAAKSSNLTETAGRSLLTQYAALQGQGIAASANAQADAIQAILANVQPAPPPPAFERSDLTLIDSTRDTLHKWGNSFVRTILTHRNADENITLLLFGNAVDTGSASSLKRLSSTAAEYRSLARDIEAIPVPRLMAVYQLQVANNYVHMAAAIGDMQQVIEDPVRGLLGLQTFVGLAANNAQIFVQINGLLKQGGIVFGKDEPGAAWGTFATQASASSARLQAGLRSGISQ